MKKANIKYRGIVNVDYAINCIETRQIKAFVRQQKQGYFFSYETETFQFHTVDRFASFPLYYTIQNGRLHVSQDVSELRSLLPDVRFDALGFYTSGGVLNGERTAHTPYNGIKKLLPGHYITWEPDHTTIQCYWSFQQYKGKTFTGSYDEACEELRFLIKQSVKRCHEFAPEAALHLSGGLDSGSVACLICQLSQEKRTTYSFAYTEQFSNEKQDEASFIPKYQKNFPQLSPHQILIEDPLSLENEHINHFGNWFGIHEDHYAHKITKKAKSDQKKIILTGLGGDELASYGHRAQNQKFRVYNDFTNEIHQSCKKHFRHFKNHIKYRLKKVNKDFIRSYQINSLFLDHEFWYHPDFILKCKTNISKPSISPFGTPATYNYRLEILDRSYFTSRSDIWNYIGKDAEVDYLHPFLDHDLVSFCAKLPTSFFQNRPPRNMFKKALIQDLPAELLEGNKRPLGQFNFDNNHWLILKIKECQQCMIEMKDSFASGIYNFENIGLQLEQLEFLLKQKKNAVSPLNASAYYFLNMIKTVLERCSYLNHNF